MNGMRKTQPLSLYTPCAVDQAGLSRPGSGMYIHWNQARSHRECVHTMRSSA